MTALDSYGSITSRYRHLAPIGRGGMAEVLLSLRDAGGGMRKVVVLKRIWPDLAMDADFVAMFHDEAQLAIRLSHPNIVQTLEVVESVGELAIAMEYLHGQPLSAVLTHHLTGPQQLSLPLRLRVLIEILAGLHYAHELRDGAGKPLGVVHRDVSPHNVFVTYDGQVKLMDFGVAKTVAAGYRTRPGAIKGKLAYLAPECFGGDIVDRRADVFAVGIMLWELLAGRRFWHGMSEAQIVHHLAGGLPLPALPHDAIRSPALDVICARALALDPNDRYPTAASLEIELQAAMAGFADSHARTLGRVVSYAFGAARREREALIARALGAGRPPATDHAKLARWANEPDGPRKVNRTAAVDDYVSVVDDTFDVTIVDPPVLDETVVRPAPLPRRNRVGAAVGALVLAGGVLGLTAYEWRRGGSSVHAASEPSHTHARAPEPATPWTSIPAAPSKDTPSSSLRAAAAPRARTPDDRAAPADAGSTWRNAIVRRGARRHHAGYAAPAGDGAEAATEASGFDEELPVTRRGPASLRRIDEIDPFKLR